MRFRSALLAAPLFLLVSWGAEAKSVDICNASPVSVSLAVSVDRGGGFRTEGWYGIDPGRCTSFSGVTGSYLYYRAESGSPLARWLNDGSPLAWDGWTTRCYNPTDAFDVPSGGECAHSAGFATATLPAAEQSTLTLHDSNHKNVPLSDAPELKRVLTGRMEYEALLRNSPGREAPFQLGITMDRQSSGVVVASVWPGMPAEEEGLQPQDVITALDGYRIDKPEDMVWVLDQVDLFRNEPLPMEIRRNGTVLDGTIVPAFFEFNHRDYSPSGAVGTFVWGTGNGILFNFGNELLCGSLVGLTEALNAVAEDRDFRGQQFAKETSNCSKGLNRELAKREILYKKAATAAFWASLIIPEAAALKAVRVNVVAACSYAAAAFTSPAASAASTTESFSGLSVTTTMGFQLRV